MPTAVGGPYFDDLEVGLVFDEAPALTLTTGMAAAHRAILGDRFRIALDEELSDAVTGRDVPVASPGLVWDVAIGQSTLATHHVKANLFYRGLRFHRFAHLGDTIRTRTEVVGLRMNSAKPGRTPTGMAALRMTSADQDGELLLDFYRCAMLPLSPSADAEGAIVGDDLSSVGAGDVAPWRGPDGWDLDAYRSRLRGGGGDATMLVGESFVTSGDVVSSAPELARLTLNIAAVHHDDRIAGSRLVYGGHTIGLALAQATRALPDMVTVLGWESCDHIGPVHEGDTLSSEITVTALTPLSRGHALGLRSLVSAERNGEPPRQVLDWRFTALIA